MKCEKKKHEKNITHRYYIMAIKDHKYYRLDMVNQTTYNSLLWIPRSDSGTHQQWQLE